MVLLVDYPYPAAAVLSVCHARAVYDMMVWATVDKNWHQTRHVEHACIFRMDECLMSLCGVYPLGDNPIPSHPCDRASFLRVMYRR